MRSRITTQLPVVITGMLVAIFCLIMNAHATGGHISDSDVVVEMSGPADQPRRTIKLAPYGTGKGMIKLSQSRPNRAAAVTRAIAWRHNCVTRKTDNKRLCQIVQQLFVKSSKKILLSVSLRKPKKGGRLAMMLHLPHGMHLPAGVVMRVDKGKPIKAAIQTCDMRGCFAGLPVHNDLLLAMKRGSGLSVAFRNLKKQTIAIKLTLVGFTAAVNKL